MVKKIFTLFAPVLIMACTISTNVTPPAPVYRNPAKLARDIVIIPAPAMEQMESESRWMNSK